MPAPIKTIADFTLALQSNTYRESDPSVAALANGQFIIGAQQRLSVEDTDIRFWNYSAAATAIGFPGWVTSPVDGVEISPSLTRTGSAVAVAYSQDGNVIVQFFNGVSAGTSTSYISPQVVLDNGVGVQGRPETVNLAGGNVAVAWVDAQNGNIETRIVDPSALIAINSTQTVTAADGGAQIEFDLGMTALSSGNYVVSWREDDGQQLFRIFNGETGVAISTETPIRLGGGGITDVIELANGRIAFAYIDFDGIYTRIFDIDGTPLTSEVTVSAGGDYIAMTQLLDGRYIIAWEQGGDIRARVHFANGTTDGDAFTVNTVTAGVQARPSLDTLADGRVVIAWETDTNGGEIVATVYDPRQSGINLIGTEQSDEFIGTAFDDVIATGYGDDGIFGGDGNDILNGGSGADEMIGGIGDDIYVVDNYRDVVTELSGQGIDVVRTALNNYIIAVNVEGVELQGSANLSVYGRGTDDFLYGNSGNNNIYADAGNDLLDGGNGNDYLAGGNGNDWLRGGAGQDQLFGDAGDDVMDGGTGDDVIYVDSFADIVIERAGEGFDIVYTALDNYTIALNVEAVELQGIANLTLYGNNESNGLYGNAGNNSLFGGGGIDLLDGGAGNDGYIGGAGDDYLRDTAGGSDTFVFNFAFGRDIIQGFEAGAPATDIILFDTATFANVGAVVAAWANDGLGNTVINAGNGNTVTILGVTTAQFSANDFGFF